MADVRREEQVCPSCGSVNVQVRHETKQFLLPYAAPVEYDAAIDCCLDCKIEGDFSGTRDKEFADLIKKAKKHSATMMIENLFEKNRFNMAYMERALELPMRTMMRWKTGDISAAALSLLRIITTYPWIVDVADSKYDGLFAKKTLIREGMNAMVDYAELHNWGGEVIFNKNAYATGESFDAHMHFFSKPEVITDTVSTSGADLKWLSAGAI